MAEARNRTEKSEYEKQRDAFHQVSHRHVLKLEADLPEQRKRELFDLADRIRILKNDISCEFNKRLEQLYRTKAYRKLLKQYKAATEADDEKQKDALGKKMASLQKKYGVSKVQCAQYAKEKNHYNIPSIFALSASDDVWSGVQKILYSNGEKLSMKKKGQLSSIKAKQSNRGIPISVRDGRLYFSMDKEELPYKYKPNDTFILEEMAAVVHYLENADTIDHRAVEKWVQTGVITDTFRPCFASLVCEEIRGRLRVFIHITIEGDPLPKKKKNGSPRHVKRSDGIVAYDLGPQSIAVVSDEEDFINNIGQRNPKMDTIPKSEKRKAQLTKKLERSQKAMNPDNYNEDGTVKRGRRKWKHSKQYCQTKKQLKNLEQKDRLSREYANREMANRIWELGEICITEKNEAKKLQKRVKDPRITDKELIITKKDGSKRTVLKKQKAKRFGKSIKKRAPGQLNALLKQKFKDHYYEVPRDYCASQYDHTCGKKVRKSLSDRLYELSDGSIVQRDLYSAFLMYCIHMGTMSVNQKICLDEFKKHQIRMLDEIDRIWCLPYEIMNSGIKPAA